MSWTAETNIKGPAGPPGTGGGGTAASITVTPTGNIAATDVQAALVELDNEKVAKAGDTMTGNLTVNKANPSLVLQKTASGQANQLAGYNSANARWSLALGDNTAEGGSNAGSNLAIYSYTDAGGALATPLTIARVDSGVTLTGMLTLPATAPSTGNHATNKTYVDTKEPAIATGTTAQYWRGDKSWQTLPASSTGIVINGSFRINQGGYVSAAVLAAAAYGHDQWKAGASGGDYSFTQLVSSTQITIAAGKSLIQPIEDVRVAGGSYVLSWTGTAQARAGVNTLTPSGAYAASPLLIAGQTAGTVMSIEFNAGTLGTVKLESGTLATPFVLPDYATELALCMRYFQKSYPYAIKPGTATSAGTGRMFYYGNAQYGQAWLLPVMMRATPTYTNYDNAGTANKTSYFNGSVWANGGANGVTAVSEGIFSMNLGIAGATFINFDWTCSARLP